MSNFILSCCSTADLSLEYLLSRDIKYVCFHYFINDKEYLDDLGQTMSLPEFYRMMDEDDVAWQIGELGKVDQGGGGTVAAYMANRNIVTVDAGVPVLCMHAPWELVSKLDCYMTMKACEAIYLA